MTAEPDAESYWLSWSKIIRTALARTSGLNLFVVLLVMAPFYLEIGASGKPGAVQSDPREWLEKRGIP